MTTLVPPGVPGATARTTPSTTPPPPRVTPAHRPGLPPTADGDSLGDLVRDRPPGSSLAGPFYTSQEIHDLDLAAVFGRSWVFVATEPEIPDPGDFVTIDIGAASLIVLRDDEGQVRALRNVCRHRGARVLTESRGSVGNLVCGYHQWTYATDGRLLSAGMQAEDFDAGCYGLRQAHVRSVGGLVFVSLAAEPPPDIDDVAARVEPYLAPHQLHRTRVAAQQDLVEHGNWKLVLENNRECYHCEGSHPELTCTFFPTWGFPPDRIPKRLRPAHQRYLDAAAELEQHCREQGIPYAEITETSGRPTGFWIQREPLDGAGESYTRDGGAVCRRLLGDLTAPRMGRLSMHVQPNAWFHFLSDHVVTFSVLPLAPDRTLVRTTWLVHEDAQEGVDYDRDELMDVWHHTNAQDAVLVARAQAGVSDPAYLPGPYSPTEGDVEAFVSWYVERLREHLS